jgi:propionate CoA-transferase
MKNKMVTADEAVALVHDGDTLCCNGFVQSGIPEALQVLLEERCRDIGKRVGVCINYEPFRIAEEVYDDYAEMDREMLRRYYTTITRYATGAFMRKKLAQAFRERNIAPHVFERKEEAQAFLAANGA